MTPPIVFAYSGGTKGERLVRLFREQAAPVVTVTLDLGQSHDLEEIRDSALAAGALRAHALDVRDEFKRDYLLPSLRAGALYGDEVPRALADAMIAAKLVELAAIEQADTVAHAAEGVRATRISAAVAALDSRLRVIAAAGEPARAAASTLPPVPDAAAMPSVAADVELTFEQGVPVAINGVAMSMTELAESLGIIARQHGVDAADPAAVLLQAAHRELETVALADDLAVMARELGKRYAQLVRDGRWFSETRRALDTFFGAAQTSLTGMVRVKVCKGQYSISGQMLASPPTPTGGRS
jgi:argininosuccinate synthase